MLMFTSVYGFQTKIQQIKTRGYITVAIPKTSHPPFITYLKDGTLEGSDIRLIEKIGKYLKVSIKYLSCVTSNEQIEAVANSKADIALGGLSVTLRRLEKVNFSIPYANLKLALLVNRLGDISSKFDYNRNIEMGVLAGSAFLEYAELRFPDAKIKLYNSSQVMLLAVKQGKLDAGLSSLNKVQYWMKENPSDALYIRIIVIPEFLDPIAVAVSYDAPDLVKWLSMLIEQSYLSEDEEGRK